MMRNDRPRRQTIGRSYSAIKNSDTGQSRLRPSLYSAVFVVNKTKPMLSNRLDTLTRRIREELREAISREIRIYQWIEGEKGRDLSWEEARNEWTEAHRENLGQFFLTGGR
jgi:hypothetical protein